MEQALWARVADFDCKGVASKMYLGTITLQETHARALLLSLFNHCWPQLDVELRDKVWAYIPVIVSPLTLCSHNLFLTSWQIEIFESCSSCHELKFVKM